MVFQLEALYLLGFWGIGLPMAILANILRDEYSILPGAMGWLLFPSRAWREYRHGTLTSVSFAILEATPGLYVLTVAVFWPVKLAFNLVCWVVIAGVVCKDWVCNTGVSSGKPDVASLVA